MHEGGEPKGQKQKPRGKAALEGNDTTARGRWRRRRGGEGERDHTLDEQFHGYRVKGTACRGSKT